MLFSRLRSRAFPPAGALPFYKSLFVLIGQLAVVVYTPLSRRSSRTVCRSDGKDTTAGWSSQAGIRETGGTMSAVFAACDAEIVLQNSRSHSSRERRPHRMSPARWTGTIS